MRNTAKHARRGAVPHSADEPLTMPRFRPLPPCALLGAVLGFGVAVTGCTSSRPAALVLSSGEVLKGTASAVTSGTFVVQKGQLQCTGTFDRTVWGLRIPSWSRPPVAARCNDRRSGKADEKVWSEGEAAILFDDGSGGRLLIGEAAEQL